MHDNYYYHYMRGPFTRRLPLLRRTARVPYGIQDEAVGRIMVIIGPPLQSCRADNDRYPPTRFNNEKKTIELYFLQTTCSIESNPLNKNDEVNDLRPVT